MEIRISVRALVEFILRSGDIDNRRRTSPDNAMAEGGRIHRMIQRRMGADYQAEVTLRYVYETPSYALVVEGRADGVIHGDSALSEAVTIDEIKGTYRDLEKMKEPVPVHLAQAKCYAYMYVAGQNRERMKVRMTYCNMETEELRYFTQEYSVRELEEWFFSLLEEYKKWADFGYEWQQIRMDSIRALVFPYAYREGQKELAGYVYRSIVRGKKLFIEAPTGVGKTLSTVFPAVKAVGEGKAERIFYLTAKTITRTVADNTFQLLRGKGLRMKTVILTAKDKICFLEEADCNPAACPFAKGHYDRINEAMYDLLLHEDHYHRETIEEYARRYQVCPFELSLDMSLFSDGIICDYNYVFDPHVYLKRFFGEGSQTQGAGGPYLFLIDEAHNLVERGREMYSAALVKEDVLLAARLVKSRSPRLARLLNACNKTLLEMKRQCENYAALENVDFLIYQVRETYGVMEEFMEENPEFEDRELVLDFYFQVRDFLNTADYMDEGYEIYSQLKEDGTFAVNLFCIDPSGRLRTCMDQGISTILFSATLLPMPYYKELLSGEPDGYAIYAQSPFPRENRLLLVGRDVSSRYSRRNSREYRKAASYIQKVVGARAGNYMIFCPSYQYMDQIAQILLAETDPEQTHILVQESHMDEAAREAFLEEFYQTQPEGQKKRSLAALCVMGGIFGEGIDLKEESLIGVVIIGTGIPQVCPRQDILRRYFDERGKPGFSYAYQYPGMNKVMQAAGRVIRTVKDEGVIVLLDDRFLWPDYLALFPREWSDYCPVTLSDVEKKLCDFWGKRGRPTACP